MPDCVSHFETDGDIEEVSSTRETFVDVAETDGEMVVDREFEPLEVIDTDWVEDTVVLNELEVEVVSESVTDTDVDVEAVLLTE